MKDISVVRFLDLIYLICNGKSNGLLLADDSYAFNPILLFVVVIR